MRTPHPLADFAAFRFLLLLLIAPVLILCEFLWFVLWAFVVDVLQPGWTSKTKFVLEKTHNVFCLKPSRLLKNVIIVCVISFPYRPIHTVKLYKKIHHLISYTWH